jgi:GNAT superfamily N-acetyltransferase
MLTSIEISTDPTRLDVGLIHKFLAADSYWARDRPLSVVERSIQNSLCFGAYRENQQVAFGRVISDRAVFAYIADVFVVKRFRGQGIATRLMRAIIEYPELKGVQLFLLRTRDAQGLYSQCGFQVVPRPEEMMALYADDSLRIWQERKPDQ